jgi:hypothetical protein
MVACESNSGCTRQYLPWAWQIKIWKRLKDSIDKSMGGAATLSITTFTITTLSITIKTATLHMMALHNTVMLGVGFFIVMLSVVAPCGQYAIDLIY